MTTQNQWSPRYVADFRRRCCRVLAILLFYAQLLTAAPPVQEVEQPAQEDQTLHYKMSVNVMAVPLFAADKHGNPVHDLKREELELLVDGNPVEMLEFKRYYFEAPEADGAGAPPAAVTETEPTVRGRVIFIILDTMFNSYVGFRRSKQIAVGLINEKSPDDRFVILENNPLSGLKYIGGAELTDKELINTINGMNAPPEKWDPHLHRNNEGFYHADSDPYWADQLVRGGQRLTEKTAKNSEKLRFKHQVLHFARVLSQFRYALKTIDRPKVVFLISEGIATGTFRAAYKSSQNEYSDIQEQTEGDTTQTLSRQLRAAFSTKNEEVVFDQDRLYSTFLFDYLMNVVKAVNNGGSVLYTINPKRADPSDEYNSAGELSLRFLSGESGGKYFSGSKPKVIVENIKKTTAAYYEIFFNVLPDMDDDLNIKVKCKRNGVRMHTLNHTEKNLPYRRMETVQKKLFALNVVNGGNWSRIVAKVMRVEGRYMKKRPSRTPDAARRHDRRVALTIPIPDVMRNKYADVFLVRIDKKSQKVTVDVGGTKITDAMPLSFNWHPDRLHYFVIIEPQHPYCIYNQIDARFM